MHHDPFQNLFQTNPMLGSYYGAPAALNPLNALAQGGIMPQQLAALLASQAVAPQLPGMSPQTIGIQNPAVLPNPMTQPGLNPLLALAYAAAQQQLALQQQHSPYSQLGQIGSPFGQIGYPPQQFGQGGSPFAQIGYPQQIGQVGYPQWQQFGPGVSPLTFGYPQQQFGNPLAPQSWVGQAGSPYGQQTQQPQAGRPFQGAATSPWGW